MNKIKKLGMFLIGTVLVLQMTGCENSGESADSGHRQTETAAATTDKSAQGSGGSQDNASGTIETDENQQQAESANEGRILIAYFTAGAG